MKQFDLFNVLVIFGIFILAIAALGTVDYSGAMSFSEIESSLQKPFEVKNWHYAYLILVIMSRK